jgi:uncharacterized protein (TIGR02598 family)
VEVVIALGIVVFCLTALTGMLLVGLSGNKASTSETTAGTILTGIVSDLRATPATASTSLLYGIPIPPDPVAGSPNATTLYVNSDGSVVSTARSSSTYLVTITFDAPPSAAVAGARNCIATFASIKVSWPAASPTALGSVQTFVSLDRN